MHRQHLPAAGLAIACTLLTLANLVPAVAVGWRSTGRGTSQKPSTSSTSTTTTTTTTTTTSTTTEPPYTTSTQETTTIFFISELSQETTTTTPTVKFESIFEQDGEESPLLQSSLQTKPEQSDSSTSMSMLEETVNREQMSALEVRELANSSVGHQTDSVVEKPNEATQTRSSGEIYTTPAPTIEVKQLRLWDSVNFVGPNITLPYDDLCLDLPTEWRARASSLEPADECVVAFSDTSCKGRHRYFTADSPDHDNLARCTVKFDNQLASFRPCNSLETFRTRLKWGPIQLMAAADFPEDNPRSDSKPK